MHVMPLCKCVVTYSRHRIAPFQSPTINKYLTSSPPTFTCTDHHSVWCVRSSTARSAVLVDYVYPLPTRTQSRNKQKNRLRTEATATIRPVTRTRHTTHNDQYIIHNTPVAVQVRAACARCCTNTHHAPPPSPASRMPCSPQTRISLRGRNVFYDVCV